MPASAFSHLAVPPERPIRAEDFEKIETEMAKIIAEDLGELTPRVVALREALGEPIVVVHHRQHGSSSSRQTRGRGIKMEH